jgi:pimeloyl-ACP methyl ester carboxylesterase
MKGRNVRDTAQANVGRIQIAYQTFGSDSSPPVLLIAGLGDQMLAWPEHFCKQLAACGYWVVRFDNRDVGLSTTFGDVEAPTLAKLTWDLIRGRRISAPYTLSDMAADSAGLLDALDVREAHIVGGSLGGMIAQTLAFEHRERVRTLTLLMTSAMAPVTAPPRPRALILFRSPPAGRDAYVRHRVNVMRAVRGPRFALDEARIRQRARTQYERSHGGHGAARQVAAMVASARDLRRRAHLITVPALVIHGHDDPVIPLPHAQHLARTIPSAQLHAIEGLGHELPPGAWHEIITAIAGFITQYQ